MKYLPTNHNTALSVRTYSFCFRIQGGLRLSFIAIRGHPQTGLPHISLLRQHRPVEVAGEVGAKDGQAPADWGCTKHAGGGGGGGGGGGSPYAHPEGRPPEMVARRYTPGNGAKGPRGSGNLGLVLQAIHRPVLIRMRLNQDQLANTPGVKRLYAIPRCVAARGRQAIFFYIRHSVAHRLSL